MFHREVRTVTPRPLPGGASDDSAQSCIVRAAVSCAQPIVFPFCQRFSTQVPAATVTVSALRRRLLLLPRVCKRWARILGRPSAAWARTEIDLYDLHRSYERRSDDLPLMDTRVISAWFCRWSTIPTRRQSPGSHVCNCLRTIAAWSRRRPNCMRRLLIEDFALNGTLPTFVTATIVGSQCSSLVSLSLVAPAVGLEGSGISALVALTQLTDLQVRSGPI